VPWERRLRMRSQIEAGRGLVQDEDARLVQERPRQHQPALHASRERRDGRVGLVRERDEREQLHRAVADHAAVESEVAAVDEKILHDVEIGIEVVLLRADPDQPLHVARPLAHVQIVDGRGPGGGRQKAGEHAHRRRLSRAVGAEKSHDLASRDLEGNPADRLHVAVGLGQVAGTNGGLSLSGFHGAECSMPSALVRTSRRSAFLPCRGGCSRRTRTCRGERA
jgi:hypothetical protein